MHSHKPTRASRQASLIVHHATAIPSDMYTRWRSGNQGPLCCSRSSAHVDRMRRREPMRSIGLASKAKYAAPRVRRDYDYAVLWTPEMQRKSTALVQRTVKLVT
jgi:hypothetical protein